MNRKNTKLLADLCHWTKVLGMGTKKKSEIPIFRTSTRGRKKESTKKNQKKLQSNLVLRSNQHVIIHGTIST